MLAASTAHAFEMGLPVDCKMGAECYIRYYIDHSPKEAVTDYTCGNLTYNGHKGTDFAVRSHAQYKKGVPVLAAQGGKVSATLNGMPDKNVRLVSTKVVKGRECGNSVVIEHSDGWKTQYCHMKKDSITVAKGDEVAKGQVIGQVGLSGNTEYPHLHFTVRRNNEFYDPFTGNEKYVACSVSPQRQSLWEGHVQKMLPYKPSGHIGSGFNDVEPDANKLATRFDAKTNISHGTDGLYFWTSLYGVKAGDRVQLKLTSPSGFVMARDNLFIQSNNPLFYGYIGSENHGLLQPGDYKGHYTLLRSGAALVSGSEKVSIR